VKRAPAVAAVLVLGALVATAPTMYDRYREKTVHREALESAENLRAQVDRFYAERRRLPEPAEAAAFRFEPHHRARLIAFEPEQKRILVTMGGTGRRFALIALESGGSLRWTCRAIDVPENDLPPRCRG
jgi:hypothetical protein